MHGKPQNAISHGRNRLKHNGHTAEQHKDKAINHKQLKDHGCTAQQLKDKAINHEQLTHLHGGKGAACGSIPPRPTRAKPRRRGESLRQARGESGETRAGTPAQATALKDDSHFGSRYKPRRTRKLGDLQAEILELTHAIRNAGQAECRNVAGAL